MSESSENATILKINLIKHESSSTIMSMRVKLVGIPGVEWGRG